VDDNVSKYCGTCRWANGFEKTATGRFKKDSCAKCSVEIKWPPVPFILIDALPRKTWGVWQANAVWPKDGENCECWEENVK
jgi:hypothetical protein